MTEEIGISMIDEFDTDWCFEMEEAIALLHQEVIRIEDREYLPSPPIDSIGIVCGVLTMNDEVEIVVRFMEGFEQLNKTELKNSYLLVEKFNK